MMAVDDGDIQLTEYTFPYTVRHVGEQITLYAEKDRKRITWRYHQPDGGRSKKRPIPKSLGAAGSVPAPTSDLRGGTGCEVRVPAMAITWAKKICEQKSDERRGIARQLAAADGKVNHVRLGYVFQRVRESDWYRGLLRKNERRLHEADRPMRWVESVLGSGFYLSGWNANTIENLIEARTEKGIATTTFDGEPTFLEPCGKNTTVGDLRILKQVFAEALEIPYKEVSEAWLLDNSPMARVKRKMPKYGVRRKREAIDEYRYQILLDFADEVDPTGRFRYFLILLRWTGRRVSTVLRLTREVMCSTEEEIRRGLEQQLCVYVLPHQIDRTAKLYAENGGAMYVRWWMVKGGQGGEAGKAEQFDAVHPVHPVVMEETTTYLERYWNKLGLGPDGPLIPGKVVTEPLSNETVYSWFRKAARLAAEAKRPLGMTTNNAYHGLRYNRRTELFSVAVKYGRWLCEHSVLSGTPGITVSAGVYQGLVPPELIRAVRTEAPTWDDD